MSSNVNDLVGVAQPSNGYHRISTPKLSASNDLSSTPPMPPGGPDQSNPHSPGSQFRQGRLSHAQQQQQHQNRSGSIVLGSDAGTGMPTSPLTPTAPPRRTNRVSSNSSTVSPSQISMGGPHGSAGGNSEAQQLVASWPEPPEAGSVARADPRVQTVDPLFAAESGGGSEGDGSDELNSSALAQIRRQMIEDRRQEEADKNTESNINEALPFTVARDPVRTVTAGGEDEGEISTTPSGPSSAAPSGSPMTPSGSVQSGSIQSGPPSARRPTLTGDFTNEAPNTIIAATPGSAMSGGIKMPASPGTLTILTDPDSPTGSHTRPLGLPPTSPWSAGMTSHSATASVSSGAKRGSDSTSGSAFDMSREAFRGSLSNAEVRSCGSPLVFPEATPAVGSGPPAIPTLPIFEAEATKDNPSIISVLGALPESTPPGKAESDNLSASGSTLPPSFTGFPAADSALAITYVIRLSTVSGEQFVARCNGNTLIHHIKLAAGELMQGNPQPWNQTWVYLSSDIVECGHKVVDVGKRCGVTTCPCAVAQQRSGGGAAAASPVNAVPAVAEFDTGRRASDLVTYRGKTSPPPRPESSPPQQGSSVTSPLSPVTTHLSWCPMAAPLPAGCQEVKLESRFAPISQRPTDIGSGIFAPPNALRENPGVVSPPPPNLTSPNVSLPSLAHTGSLVSLRGCNTLAGQGGGSAPTCYLHFRVVKNLQLQGPPVNSECGWCRREAKTALTSGSTGGRHRASFDNNYASRTFSPKKRVSQQGQVSPRPRGETLPPSAAPMFNMGPRPAPLPGVQPSASLYPSPSQGESSSSFLASTGGSSQGLGGATFGSSSVDDESEGGEGL